MSRYAFNNEKLGDYDFLMQYIQIYLEKVNVSICRAQEIVKNGGSDINNESELSFYKTYIHEMQHFLDCTTTLWGLNFTARAYNYYRNKATNALEVFCIDFGEIAKHNRLRVSMEDFGPKLQLESIKTYSNYSPDYGVFISIHYLDSETIVHSTPISTISVLENHAYAQEQIFALKYYRNKNDIVSIKLLEREINDLLKEARRTEYTSLISLTKKVMPNLSLEYVLIAITVITRITLNTPFLYSFIRVEVINEVFKPMTENWKNTIRTDLSRGANVGSRFYILLMWLAIYNDNNPLNQNGDFVKEVNDIILDAYLPRDDFETYEILRLNDLHIYLEKLRTLNAQLPVEVACQDIYKNDIYFNASNYKLPDVILSTGEIIYAKKMLNSNIVKHTDDIMSMACSLESQSLNHPRMHMSPAQSQSFYEESIQVIIKYDD
ncbi:hypothetical protein [Pantoea agglomerans]|uniref:hypothetical protein n=1 Tax=Enterobacter agglomerans TaxID=549 RepID=UPI00026D234E|nr:hypothetical protein [Pantoea agglomerans]